MSNLKSSVKSKLHNFSKAEIDAIINAVEDSIIENLNTSGEVVIGKTLALKVSEKKQCNRKNPQTGEPVISPAGIKVKLVPRAALKDFIKSKEKPLTK